MKDTHWVHVRTTDTEDWTVIYVDGVATYKGNNLNVEHFLAKLSTKFGALEITKDCIWEEYYYGNVPEFLRSSLPEEVIDDADDYTNEDEYEDPFFPETITKDMIEHVKHNN